MADWNLKRMPSPVHLTLSVIVLAFPPTGPTLAAGAPCVEGRTIVTGIVQGLATIQEEPSASPQSSFILAKPSCGDREILVGGPAPILCSDGDLAIVQGRYLPPSRLIDVPILDGAKVECRSADPTGSDTRG
jgi:hypothetical protein